MTKELTLEQMLAKLIPTDSAEVSIDLDTDVLTSISAPTEAAGHDDTQILKRLDLQSWPR